MVLFLGLGAGVVLFIVSNVRPQTLMVVILLALGAGSVVLLYLLSASFRFVSYGFILVLVGYIIQITGVMMERKNP